MVVKWNFTNPFTSDTEDFLVNPNEGGTPTYKKNIASQTTVTPGGRPVVWEGSLAPSTISFSGVILEEAQYNMVISWFGLFNQILLTDDLGREFTIYITDFSAKRERARSHPWKHTYTVEAIILENLS